MSDAQRIETLEKLIKHHQDCYYNNMPEISDADYDALWDELAQLKPGSEVIARIGADSSDRWPKARHVMVMGSQNKATQEKEFFDWAKTLKFTDFIVEWKLDGASLELQYENGALLRAVTRGDGIAGDDITQNARKMQGACPRLADGFTGSVRGEVMLSRALHKERHAEKANCRNAANGLMKRKDGRGCEDLEIICYDALGQGDDNKYLDEPGKLFWLAQMGFKVVQWKQVSLPQAVVEYRAEIAENRIDLPFDIDGIIVKGIQIDHEDAKKLRPEKQIAFKFDLELAETTLEGIEWSESGVTYTPIAMTAKVRLAGTNVSRANLVNTSIIKKLGLKIGSRVLISKRGEIIPKIESLVANPPGCSNIQIPSVCSCGTALVDEGSRLFCPNVECPKIGLHRLEKWLNVLDVIDFGPAIVRKLYESGRVTNIPQLYRLTVADLTVFDKMGDTLAKKILARLASIKTLSLPAFIAAFDIEGVGELVAAKIVNAGYTSIDALRYATIEELLTISGIGPRTAEVFVQGMAKLGDSMQELIDNGYITLEMQTTGKLSGKSFCFTGELTRMKRSQAEALVKSKGGEAKPGVTKTLSYLVSNDAQSTSGKTQQAKSLGIPIISEDEFFAML